MDEEIEIGKHILRKESDTGFLVLIQHGDFDGEHARHVMTEFERLSTGGHTYLLCDNRKAGTMTMEARRAFGAQQGVSSDRVTHVAIFGGSFSFRVIVNLVMKALEISGQAVSTIAAPDEAAARAWLHEEKRKAEAAA